MQVKSNKNHHYHTKCIIGTDDYKTYIVFFEICENACYKLEELQIKMVCVLAVIFLVFMGSFLN